MPRGRQDVPTRVRGNNQDRNDERPAPDEGRSCLQSRCRCFISPICGFPVGFATIRNGVAASAASMRLPGWPHAASSPEQPRLGTPPLRSALASCVWWSLRSRLTRPQPCGQSLTEGRGSRFAGYFKSYGPACPNIATARQVGSRQRHRSREGPSGPFPPWWKFSKTGWLDMPMMPSRVVVPIRKSAAGSLAGAQGRYGRATFADSPRCAQMFDNSELNVILIEQ
jgi:hypothetical protein